MEHSTAYTIPMTMYRNHELYIFLYWHCCQVVVLGCLIQKQKFTLCCDVYFGRLTARDIKIKLNLLLSDWPSSWTVFDFVRKVYCRISGSEHVRTGELE